MRQNEHEDKEACTSGTPEAKQEGCPISRPARVAKGGKEEKQSKTGKQEYRIQGGMEEVGRKEGGRERKINGRARAPVPLKGS